MITLLLINHSSVQTDARVPAAQWRLSEAGRRRCSALAERLAPYAPQVVVTSREPKAAETGALVAAHLGLPVVSALDLHEHDRTGVPFLGRAEFEAVVADFFARPHELVFGRETAHAALTRFQAAVAVVTEQYPDQTMALAAHGTVISLLVAHLAGVDGFDLWQRLDLPSFVVLDWPSGRLVDVVTSV